MDRRISRRTRIKQRWISLTILRCCSLEHDASFQAHSPFSTMTDFLETADRRVCQGGPAAPPSGGQGASTGRWPGARSDVSSRRLARDSRALQSGVFTMSVAANSRGFWMRPAAPMTVNSTAAQQVLWRGIPLKTFGQAVYDKPEFVSTKSSGRFLCRGRAAGSQGLQAIIAGFCWKPARSPADSTRPKGVRQLLRQAVDMMLSPYDPYDALKSGTAAPRQQLRVVT